MSKKTKRKRKYRDANYSGIRDHRRVGKQLIPPLKTIQNFNTSSWRDDHAPEMLWAFLLAATLPRDTYLGCFRKIVAWMRATFPPIDRSADTTPERVSDKGAPINDACEIDHTSLAELSDQHFEQFIKIPLAHPLGYGALRPLLLLDSLPGVHRWRTALGVDPTEHDWQTLAAAVIETLDHQSEISTDVRWLKYILKIVLGKVFFATGMRETVEEILAFPNKGDMRRVRPSIRSGEMMLRRNPASAWIEQYWGELLTKNRFQKCPKGLLT